MKIEVGEGHVIQIREIYNPINLKTRNNENMLIYMVDTGFEFYYQNEKYSAQNGIIEKVIPQTPEPDKSDIGCCPPTLNLSGNIDTI